MTCITVPAGTTIRDAAGNDAVLTGAATTFTGLQIDTTAPTVTSDTAEAAAEPTDKQVSNITDSRCPAVSG